MKGEWQSDLLLLILLCVIVLVFVLGRWQPWH